MHIRNHYLHKRWDNMVQRCGNPNRHNYSNYGGRGIQVDPRIRSFWDYVSVIEALPKPDDWDSKGYQIDRIDNDGNYAPGNLRWLSLSEQNRNSRKHRNSTSIYKGASWNAREERWTTSLRIGSRMVHLGYFDSDLEAHLVWRDTSREWIGAYPVLCENGQCKCKMRDIHPMHVVESAAKKRA